MNHVRIVRLRVMIILIYNVSIQHVYVNRLHGGMEHPVVIFFS